MFYNVNRGELIYGNQTSVGTKRNTAVENYRKVDLCLLNNDEVKKLKLSVFLFVPIVTTYITSSLKIINKEHLLHPMVT